MSTTNFLPPAAREDATETAAEYHRTRCRVGRECGACQACTPVDMGCVTCGEKRCVCVDFETGGVAMERIHVSRIEGDEVYGHYVDDCGKGHLACETDTHFFCSVAAYSVEEGGVYDLDADHNVVREVA